MPPNSSSSTEPPEVLVKCQSLLLQAFQEMQADKDQLNSRLRVAEDKATGYAETALKLEAIWQTVEPQMKQLTDENKRLKRELAELKRGDVGSPLGSSKSDVEQLSPRVQDLLSSQRSTIQKLKLDLAKTQIDLGQATADQPTSSFPAA